MMIRAVVIEESAAAVEQLLKSLGEFQQVNIIGTATEGVAGLELCNELCPDAVFLDINLSDQAGILLAIRLAVLEEFPTYYLVAQLMRWLRGEPFVQVGRHAIVNLRAIQEVWRQSDRVYRLRMYDRTGTVINASRSGSTRLLAEFKARTGSQTLAVPVSWSHRKVAARF